MHTKHITHSNNPQIIQTIIPYSAYNTHKVIRKQVQTQRQHIQHQTALLQRQAKKQVKQLYSKEKSLMNLYRLRQSRFQDMKRKVDNQRKMQSELKELRQTNNSFREHSIQKRNSVRKQWQNTNKRLANDIKHFRSQSQRKLSQQKSLQKDLLKKRNEAFSKAIALGNQHSRIKNYYSKRFISSQVKSDLINVQENIKKNELEKITNLNERQQHLMEIVERTRKDYHHYDHTLAQVKGLPFEQMYPKIKSVRDRKSQSRKSSSSRGHSLII